MRRRAIAGAGAGALGAVTAAAALLIGSATGYAASGPSEAYGVFITGVIDPPQPYVQSVDGTEQSDAIFQAPENPLIGLDLAEVTAGDSEASVQLLGLEVVPGAEVPPELQDLLDQIAEGFAPVCTQEPPTDQLPPELSDLIPKDIADQLDPAKLCEGLEGGAPAVLSLDLVTVACAGTAGSVQVAGLALLGQEIDIPANPEPNTEIPLGPAGSITFNKQGNTEDGFTVQGAAIDLGGQLEIILASATCGQPTEEPAPSAPKPTPVTTGLPVTG
ncbi:MAG: choice-of-anchor P family protein [Pseudonocardiaceae bacterium]